MRQSPRVLIFLLLLILLLLLVRACVNPFAPGLTEHKLNSNLILTEQRTPAQVLTNFRYAYTFKDSLIYSDLLDSSFLFISKNFATDPVTDLTWGRDVDIKTTMGLFRHFQNLDLTWGGAEYQRYLNIDSTLCEIQQSFRLTLDGGRDFPPITGKARFNLIKKKLNAPEMSDVWKITRWEDLSSF